jgi:hypothetical protein
MAETVATGLTGSITFTNTTPVVNGRFGRWRLRVSYEPLEETGFGATMHQRGVGLGDFQGQAIGYILTGDAAANPGLTSTTTPSLAVITLQADGTNSVITATAMVTAVDLESNILGTTGDPLGITFLGAGAHIQVNWGGSAIA